MGKTLRKACASAMCLIMTGALLFLGAAVGCFLFCNFSSFITHNDFLDILTEAKAVLTVYPKKQQLTPSEIASLHLLVENGVVLTQDQLLGMLAEFYNNILNSLVVILSLLGLFTFISIRSLSKRDAETVAHEEVGRVVETKFQDIEFVENLFRKNADTSYLIDESNTRNKNIEALRAQLDKLQEDYSFLMEALQSLEPRTSEERPKRLRRGKGKNGGYKTKY